MRDLVREKGSVKAAVDHLVQVFRMGRPRPINAEQNAELERQEKKYRLSLSKKIAQMKAKHGRSFGERKASSFARTDDHILFATQSQSSTSTLAGNDDDDDFVALSQVINLQVATSFFASFLGTIKYGCMRG